MNAAAMHALFGVGQKVLVLIPGTKAFSGAGTIKRIRYSARNLRKPGWRAIVVMDGIGTRALEVHTDDLRVVT